MQYYTALNAKADVIITRNGKDFAASKIPVMTATEYLATIEGWCSMTSISLSRT